MEMIVKKTSIGDYIQMTAICMSWRSMLANEHVTPSDLEAPWILQLKDCEHNDDR